MAHLERVDGDGGDVKEDVLAHALSAARVLEERLAQPHNLLRLEAARHTQVLQLFLGEVVLRGPQAHQPAQHCDVRS